MTAYDNTKPVKAVCFDVGATLLTPVRPEYETIADILSGFGHSFSYDEVHRQIGPMYGYYEEIYDRDNSVWADNERARAMWVEIYHFLCTRLGLNEDISAISEKIYREYFTPTAWRCFDDVLPTIRGLRERKVSCGIISNWDSSLRGILDALSLSPYFETIISSADVGLYKPEPEIFALATGNLAVSSAEAWHIGDHMDADVRGADRAGLTGILLAREGHRTSSYRATIPLGVGDQNLVVSDLRELLDLVDKANS